MNKFAGKVKDFDLFTKVSGQESQYDFGIRISNKQMANRYKQSSKKLIAVRNK